MTRNTALPKYKGFKNELHFHQHKIALIKQLYPEAIIKEKIIEFTNPEYVGIEAEITAGSLYVFLSREFRQQHPVLLQNQSFELPLLNTRFSSTGSTGKGYMYPRDRSEFPDTELGMEQKAIFFVMVLEMCLKQLSRM